MKKLVLVLLAVVCGVSFMGSAYAAVLAKGDIAYVRSNLHAEGSKIFWHNMRVFKNVIPVGTEVTIKGCTGNLITFVTNDTNKKYYLYADSKGWNKYFVKDKNEIGLNNISSDRRSQIDNGDVIDGMTKEEVYVSKGCPAYIAWGKTTEKKSFDEIMQSDKWYYMTNTRGHDVMVTFANGAVVKTGGFEK
jgi:hypothetical protein